MADASSDTLLERFSHCEATLRAIEHRLDEQALGVTRLELSQSGVLAKLADMNEAARTRLRALNDISARLERIEHRLELSH